MRSLLLTRADDLAQAMASGADAVIVDLVEDSEPDVLTAVRDALSAVAENEMRPLVFVRLDAVDTPATDAALAALMPAEPDGFMIGRCAGGADVQHLGAKLAVHEAELDLADGQTAIVAEVGAVARSVLVLDSFVDCSPRLLALAWNPQLFAAALELDDAQASPSTTARSLVVITARAAAIAAIDFGPDGDDESLGDSTARARRDGFNARIVRTPAQLPIVDAVFNG